jgi:Virulence activator alpha C-term
MEEEWREHLTSTDGPEFASYATLRRGISYEKEYAEWCRWMADSIKGQKKNDG